MHERWPAPIVADGCAPGAAVVDAFSGCPDASPIDTIDSRRLQATESLGYSNPLDKRRQPLQIAPTIPCAGEEVTDEQAKVLRDGVSSSRLCARGGCACAGAPLLLRGIRREQDVRGEGRVGGSGLDQSARLSVLGCHGTARQGRALRVLERSSLRAAAG